MKIRYTHTRLIVATLLIFTSSIMTAMQVDQTGKLGDLQVWNSTDLATQIENFKNYDMGSFGGNINFVANIQNVKNILLAFINQPADQLSRAKIGRLILEFDKFNRAAVTFNAADGDIIAALDKNHTRMYTETGHFDDNSSLSHWKKWFMEHGVVVSPTPQPTTTAAKSTATTQTAQPKKVGRPLTVQEYKMVIDCINRDPSLNTLLIFLKPYKDVNFNQYILVRNEALRTDMYQNIMEYVLGPLSDDKKFLYAQLLLANSTTDLNATLDLNGHSTTLIQELSSKQRDPKVLEWLRNNGVTEAAQTTATTTQPTSTTPRTFSFALNRTQALVSAAVTGLGLYAAYRWFTKGAEAADDKDLLVNKTESNVFFRMDSNNPSSITTGPIISANLPQSGTMTFVNTDAPDPKKLFDISLDQYTQARKDNYLTITIRPARWYEQWWYKTPIYYSVSWKQKNTGNQE